MIGREDSCQVSSDLDSRTVLHLSSSERVSCLENVHMIIGIDEKHFFGIM